MVDASNESVLGLIVVARWKRRCLLFENVDDDIWEFNWAIDDEDDDDDDDESAVTVGIIGLFKSSSFINVTFADRSEAGVWGAGWSIYDVGEDTSGRLFIGMK